METDKLCKILEDKAVKDERDKLKAIAQQFNKDIGLAGTTSLITTRGDKSDDNKNIEVYISTLLSAIVDGLVEEREARIKANAVTGFMKQFESFSNHMLTIEQYAQDMLE